MKEEITPLIAAFLLYIKRGETPANAADMAAIDILPIFMEKNESMVIRMVRHQIFDFLHPEIEGRIKTGAKMLQCWYINFDVLKYEELEAIQKYIEDLNRYFQS